MSLTKESTVGYLPRTALKSIIPRRFVSIDPLTYAGRPTGEYKVRAVASLSILDHDRVLGEYTAQTNVTKSYGLFSQPTHREIDDEAKAAVRAEIDRKLSSDAWRLADTISGTE